METTTLLSVATETLNLLAVSLLYLSRERSQILLAWDSQSLTSPRTYSRTIFTRMVPVAEADEEAEDGEEVVVGATFT